MNKFILIFIISIILINLKAQYQGPIPEITSGYGAMGTHIVESESIENTSVASNVLEDRTITVFYPQGTSSPLPTVLFAPGYNQFDPAIFQDLINFVVSNGYTFVYAPCRSTGGDWFNIHYANMKLAIDSFPNLIDTTQIGIMGHSVGGGAVAWLGKKFFMDHNYGLNGRFMFALSAWINFEITQTDLDNFPSDVGFIMQYFEADTGFSGYNGTDPRIGIDIYNNINISKSEKDFIMINSSIVSGYEYNTEHNFPSSTPFDALDYYGIFRLLDAMIDYKWNGNCYAKYICLGNGADAQIDMNIMENLSINSDVTILPSSHYAYECDVPGNPRRTFCNSANIQSEPFIEYIDSVFLNSQSCNILDTGFLIISYTNEHFCDSIVSTHTSLLNSNDTTIYLSSCLLEEAGTFTENLYNVHSCDSIVTLVTELLPTNDTLLTNITTNISDTGTVSNTYTNIYGCDSTFTVITNYFDPNSIKNINTTNIIIKNPVYNYLIITNHAEVQYIELIDMKGKNVLSIDNDFKKIDVSKLNRSLYYLSIHTKNGIYFKKIVLL